VTSDTSWVDSMPAVYDRALGPALFAPFAAYLAEAVVGLTPRRVLELAAGTGVATGELIAALPGTEVVATDLNPAMVAFGAAKVPGATWRVADALHLDEPAGSYDLVVCQFGVMFFPDKPAAFAEAARVLRPGGRLLVAVWDVVEASPFPAALMAGIAAARPVDPPTFVARVPHGYPDPEQIEADLRAGGLEPVSVERVVLQGTSPSAATLADGFCRGTPLRFALQERGDLDELTAAIAAEMTARLGEGPVEGDLAALVVAARRP